MLEATGKLLLFCLLVTLSGCQLTPGPHPETFITDQSDLINQPYTLDVGDTLKITVFGHSSLSGRFSVQRDGTIDYPLVGKIPARGKVPDDVRDHVRQALAKEYIRDPKVTVSVALYRDYYIYGEIPQTGRYAFSPGMTMHHALIIAGGHTATANYSTFRVTRYIGDKIVQGNIKLTSPLLPGDVIYVKRWPF